MRHEFDMATNRCRCGVHFETLRFSQRFGYTLDCPGKPAEPASTADAKSRLMSAMVDAVAMAPKVWRPNRIEYCPPPVMQPAPPKRQFFDDMSVSYDAHQAAISEFQNTLAAKDAELADLRAQLADSSCDITELKYQLAHQSDPCNFFTCPFVAKASISPSRALLTLAPNDDPRMGWPR